MGNLESLKKHKYIIIGIDHYNPLGIARSLGMHGIASILIIKKSGRLSAKIASASKYVKVVHRVDSFDELPELLLSQYGSEEYKPFVYPCDDVATMTLDASYDSLKDHFYIENCGEPGRIEYFMRKEVLNEVAKRHGLRVARTWNLESDALPDNIIYPVITKPVESYEGWKKDYYVCRNEAELKEALGKVNGKVFIQQYIQKVTELCLDGLVINQGRENFVSIASTYTYILPDYYSMEMVVSNFDDEELLPKINSLFQEIRYEGIYSLEFLIDENGEAWFLEINFRNSTWSWASTCVGMNLPLLWASGVFDGKIPPDARKKIPKHYIALAEIPDYEQRVRKHKMITTKEWYANVKRANCLFYYDKHDKRPALSVWLRILVKMLLKRE